MPGHLLNRLTSQLRERGVDNPEKMAAAMLTKRGHMKNGKLTPEGKKRQELGNSGRAKERAVKYQGGKPSDYKYNPKTNLTKKKK